VTRRPESKRRATRRRLPAWLRPRRTLRPSRAGWLYVAITFGVGFAALNTGNNLLYLVLSLMLAFLVLSGFLSESALRGVRVERQLPREIYAGMRNRVVLRVHNADRRLASFALVIEDRIRDGSEPIAVGRVFALRVGPGEMLTRDYALVPESRGPLTFESFRISTRFPFGLFVKSVVLDAEAGTLVFPTIARVTPRVSEQGREEHGDSDRERKGQGVLLMGLREYAPGDGLRRVAWRQSARRGALFVGESEEEQVAEVEVELPRSAAGHADVFESQVVRAASEVAHHLDAGLRVALRTPDEHFAASTGRHHRVALMRHLALVEPESADSDVRTGAREGAHR